VQALGVRKGGGDGGLAKAAMALEDDEVVEVVEVAVAMSSTWRL
jgi:spermidine synthase